VKMFTKCEDQLVARLLGTYRRDRFTFQRGGNELFFRLNLDDVTLVPIFTVYLTLREENGLSVKLNRTTYILLNFVLI
jgi:hypothetical protein